MPTVTTEHHDTAIIPRATAEIACQLAGMELRLSMEQDSAKAARMAMRHVLEQDVDYEAAKEMKRDLAKSTAGQREEIAALLNAANKRAMSGDAGKALTGAKERAKRLKQAIKTHREESKQTLMPWAMGWEVGK
jgi:hypothetical protein